ncbi:cytochrome P450 [Laetiporus sulphureus 93-53]|uniref:Cytochrome P450 n=1 Tax=Laetiporus sulphureus 93-53 TaxID=1314785 RepID=A0A165C5B1_9APHY|nr:cytochrome P450 [Laetiporus sulphureus 93-53]KZT02231.1 cytochrome P450 [Laetiporus sulphureus 93-53]
MDQRYLLALPLAVFLYGLSLKHRKIPREQLPPEVEIPPEEIFSRPKEAYKAALQAYGPVIAVRRKGNLEYIVGPKFSRHVLTCDHLFSFEQGSAAIMNLQPIMALTKGSLFRDLNDFVREGIIDHIDEIINKIFPIYDRDGKAFMDLVSQVSKIGVRPDSFLHSRDTISETTLILLLGQEYVTRRNMDIIENVSNGMAELTGQYQNFSFLGKYFPWFWVLFTWVNVILVKIPFGFLRPLGPKLWEDVNRYELIASSGISPKDEPRNVLYHIVKTYSTPERQHIGVFRRIYIGVLLLCLIFASVHTTTVVSQWVLFQLAVHPECLGPIREELLRIREEDETGALRFTAASLREAHLLDSFVREVMRLKGDTISTMRYTTCDAPLGDYIIPKGSFITPMSCTVHENPEVFGDEPMGFNGFQWAEQNKDAAMTGSAHIVFGLGRFACPGRVLAVFYGTEIKLIVLCLIGRATPSLLEGRFEVTDPLNTVTQPPKGTLVFTPLEQPLL